MEVNLRQRVIGGVVLVALAVIFLPLLFKGSAIKSKRVAIETSIPAAPAKPTAQTTITMQSEELNQPRAALTENNTPDQALLTQNQQQGQPVAQRQPIQAMPQKEVETKAMPSEMPSPQVMNSNAKKVAPNEMSDQQVMNSKAAKVVPNEIPSPRVINAKAADAALAESIAEITPAAKSVNKSAKTQTNKIYAKVQAKTASNKAKTAANNKAKATNIAAANSTTKAAKSKVQAAQLVSTTKMTKSKTPLQPAKAWVVQLGSFGDTAKAKTLEKQLRAKGFTAYSRSVKTTIGSMTRVYVGPEVKREKANASLARLDSDMHIKGVVVAFDPQQVK